MDNLVKAAIEAVKRIENYKSEITSITPYNTPPEVHLSLKAFLDNFDDYKLEYRDSDIFPVELISIEEGVKFFSIANVGDFHHAS